MMEKKCSHNNLVAHYPHIWRWGIVWECEECHNFYICDCFKSTIECFVKEGLKQSMEKKSFVLRLANYFPPSFLNYLANGTKVAYFEYHGNVPSLRRYECNEKELVNGLINFLEKRNSYFLPKICHICRKLHSDHYFCGDSFGSFKKRYGAYIYKQLFEWGLTHDWGPAGTYRNKELVPDDIKRKYFDGIEIPVCGYCKNYMPPIKRLRMALKNKIREEHFQVVDKDFVKAEKMLIKDLENEIRKKLDYPLIGKCWVQETTLFKLIKKLLPQYEVIHHYYPQWLVGLELDIYINELNIGIEYQGEQHFKPINFFGGKKGYKRLVERDHLKKTLCEANDTKLLYFLYNEDITMKYVKEKLSKHIISLKD